MAVQFIGKSTFVSNIASVTQTFPTYQAGDLLVLFFNSANQAPPNNPTSSGYTLIDTQTIGTAGAAGGCLISCWYKIAGASETAFVFGDSGNLNNTITMSFRGVSATTPLAGTTTKGTTTAATTFSALGMTTTADNAMVVHAIGLDADAASSVAIGTPPVNANLTSLTRQHAQTVSTAAGGGIAVVTGFKATAGATGATTGSAVTSAVKTYVTFALNPELSPTVALGSPANNATVVTATPSLTFTGTDANSDAIDYEVQVDTSSTFNNATNVLNKSYSDSNYDTLYPIKGDSISATYSKYGQSYISDGRAITKAQFYIKQSTLVTGAVISRIYNSTGDHYPSTLITESDPISVSSLSTTYSLVDFNFSPSVTVTNGAMYVITVELINGTYTNDSVIDIGADASSPSGEGQLCRYYPYSGVWLSYTTLDTIYAIYTTGPLINALSTDHTGFSAGASHPTASGVEQTYTVQTALAAGTYYWRVRGIDSTGSNTWGVWSPGDSTLGYDSFTVSLGPTTWQVAGAMSTALTMAGVLSTNMIMSSTSATTTTMAGNIFATRAVVADVNSSVTTMAGSIYATRPMVTNPSVATTIMAGAITANRIMAGTNPSVVTMAGNIFATRSLSTNLNTSATTMAGNIFADRFLITNPLISTTTMMSALSLTQGLFSNSTSALTMVGNLVIRPLLATVDTSPILPTYIMEETDNYPYSRTIYPPDYAPNYSPAVGDLWLIGFMTSNEPITLAGFTQVTTPQTYGPPADPAGLRLTVLYKIITASDISGGVYLNNESVVTGQSNVAFTIRNVNRTNPIQGFTTYLKDSVDTTVSTPSITTTKDKSAVLSFFAWIEDDQNAGGQETGTNSSLDTDPFLLWENTTSFYGGGIGGTEGLKTTAGVVGPTTWDWMPVASRILYLTVALNPIEPIKNFRIRGLLTESAVTTPAIDSSGNLEINELIEGSEFNFNSTGVITVPWFIEEEV